MRAPVQKINAKNQAETPFRILEKDGFTILLGRNNLQNDRLLKIANPDDIWLHAQKYHSSHAIIKTDGNPLPDSVLVFTAELCAYYSSGRDSGKIPVDYCKRKMVKKPPKSKAGFVVYTGQKTLLVEPKKS